MKELIEVAKTTNKNQLVYCLTILNNFYVQLGLNNESDQLTNQILNLYKGENSSNAYLTKGNIYISKIQLLTSYSEFNDLNLDEQKNKNTILNYAKKAYHYYNKIDSSNQNYLFFKLNGLNTMHLAYYNLNNVDSTIYYTNQLKYYFEKNNQLKENKLIFFFYYFAQGRTFLLKEEYSKALFYFNKALKNIEYNSSPESKMYLYKDLSKTYTYLSDTLKNKEYTLQYFHLKDSISNVRNNIRNAYHDEIIKKSQKRESEKYYGLIISFFILLLLISLFFIFYKKKKRELTDQTNKTLVLNNLDKLLELAKSNDILFQTTFYELYPEFIAKIPISLTEDEIKNMRHAFEEFD